MRLQERIVRCKTGSTLEFERLSIESHSVYEYAQNRGKNHRLNASIF